MLLWSSQNSLSKSKAVKSCAAWFFVVPFVAKILENFNNQIIIKISGYEHVIELGLPFKWQLLFFVSMFFMLANIVYQMKSKSIVKSYSSFSDFKLEGKGRLQINQYFKDVAWDNSNKKIRDDKIDIAYAYLVNYCKNPPQDTCSLRSNHNILLDKLDDLVNAKGQDGDAFYFVYNIADSCNKYWLIISLILYLIGFLFLSIVAIVNIKYVVATLF